MMSVDPDLQGLIDARKAADRQREQDAIDEATSKRKAEDQKLVWATEWKDFTSLLNEEAGRINSVRDAVGVYVEGASRSRQAVSLPNIAYTFRVTMGEAQVRLSFTQHLDGKIVADSKLEGTRKLELLELSLEEKLFEPNIRGVRSLFGETVKLLVKA